MEFVTQFFSYSFFLYPYEEIFDEGKKTPAKALEKGYSKE